jgi:hypothetical protein
MGAHEPRMNVLSEPPYRDSEGRRVLADFRWPTDPAVRVRYYACAGKEAHFALCLDCGNTVGGLNTFPAPQSAWLHTRATGHQNLRYVKPGINREEAAQESTAETSA